MELVKRAELLRSIANLYEGCARDYENLVPIYQHAIDTSGTWPGIIRRLKEMAKQEGNLASKWNDVAEGRKPLPTKAESGFISAEWKELGHFKTKDMPSPPTAGRFAREVTQHISGEGVLLVKFVYQSGGNGIEVRACQLVSTAESGEL